MRGLASFRRSSPTGMHLFCLFLLGTCLLIPMTPGVSVARAKRGPLWLGVRGGVHVFNRQNPEDIDALATALSDPTAVGRIDFDGKRFEIPFGLRLGLQPSERFSLYLMYERMPYVLERSSPALNIQNGVQPPPDSIRFEAPANLWGLGFDLGGPAGGMQSLRLGAAVGILDMDGNDEDVLSFVNMTLEGRGFFVELSVAREVDFEEELTIYPFVAYRLARTTTATARDVRAPLESDIPSFDVKYTGLSFGIELRFRPFAASAP